MLYWSIKIDKCAKYYIYKYKGHPKVAILFMLMCKSTTLNGESPMLEDTCVGLGCKSSGPMLKMDLIKSLGAFDCRGSVEQKMLLLEALI